MKMMVWLMLLIVGIAKGDGEKTIFSASINCLPSYQSTHNITCSFHLKNSGDCGYSVLKWHTPLDGLNSDCLKVTRNGQKLHYDGIYAKRSMPGPEEFILVGAGQTVSSTFDVSEAYDMSKDGNYSVALDTYIEYAKGSVESMNVAGKPGIHTKVGHLSSPVVTFIISGRGSSKRTLGQRARSLEINSKRTFSVMDFEKRSVPLDPRMYLLPGRKYITITDANKIAAVKLLHRLAHAFIVYAIKELQGRSVGRFETWFGKAKKASVLQKYQEIEGKLRTERVTYVYGGHYCSRGWDRYSYMNWRQIHLCSPFENFKLLEGDMNQVGIIIHELSHIFVDTMDYAGRPDGCKALAQSDPAKATNNADTYMYYLTTLLRN